MPGFFGSNNSKSLFSNDTLSKNKCNQNTNRIRRKNKIVKRKVEKSTTKKIIKKDKKSEPNFRSFIDTFKGLKDDMNDLFDKNNNIEFKKKNEHKLKNSNIESTKKMMNTMYNDYMSDIKNSLSSDSNSITDSSNKNFSENIIKKNNSKRLHSDILTVNKFINKADYNVVFNDDVDNLVQEILVDDKLKINNTIVVSKNAIDDINEEISKVLVKIDKNLNITNNEIFDLKKKVYNLLNLEEEPLIVSLDDTLPIQ
jgi:hypothetical protein